MITMNFKHALGYNTYNDSYHIWLPDGKMSITKDKIEKISFITSISEVTISKNK